MPGDIQNRQTIFRQVGKRLFPLKPVPFLHPGKLGITCCSCPFLASGELFLIHFPCFQIDGAYRLRGNLSQGIRVRSFLKLPQPFAQLSHAEHTVYGGCLHGLFPHKNDGPGAFFLETQTDFRQFFVQFGPRLRVFYDGMAALLRDALGGFFAGGMFKIQRGLLRFYFAGRPSSRQLAIFQYRIHGVFFTGPSLPAFNMGHELMRLLNVQSIERKHDFSRFRVRPVDRDMQVIIVRVIMHPIHGLMSGQPHFFQKHVHHFLHLFPGGLFPFLPGKHPVLHRHVAVNRLPCQSNHFHLLTGMCC